MPTNAFFNLSDDKKDKIINAAIDEFSKNLFVDASINKIIKAIDMPRGSFYLYFENKEDLYFYVISLYAEKFAGKFKEVLDKNKGDLIDTFINLFDDVVNISISNRMKEFIHKVFLNMNTQNMNYFFEKTEKENKFCFILSLIDKSKLNVEKEFDIFCMFKTLMILLIHSLSHTFNNNMDSSVIRDIYVRQLHIIKKGFYV